tara:strand:+ start:446 stop:1081 length:636 start_codon:yes stop_codon:yes gene_type:complete
MIIDIKQSTKPVKYKDAIDFLEKRVDAVNKGKANELIWILEHPHVFTGGKRYKKSEVLDSKIKIVKTSRGGKITWHGPGQLICYFVIDLNKRKKDIRKLVNLVEKTVIDSLKSYKINSFSDRKNIGIWVSNNRKIIKIGAIGIKVKKWIAYHGFSLNISNNLKHYKRIIPCGIKNREVSSLKLIKNQKYNKLKYEIVENLINNLKNKSFFI